MFPSFLPDNEDACDVSSQAISRTHGLSRHQKRIAPNGLTIHTFVTAFGRGEEFEQSLASSFEPVDVLEGNVDHHDPARDSAVSADAFRMLSDYSPTASSVNLGEPLLVSPRYLRTKYAGVNIARRT